MNIKKIVGNSSNWVLSRKVESTRVDDAHFPTERYDTLILRNSISTYCFYIALPTFLIILVLGAGKLQEVVELISRNWLFGTLVSMLPFILIFIGINGLVNRRPILIVDEIGIKTSTTEYKWDEIFETKIITYGNGAAYLKIFTSEADVKIGISDLNMSPQQIGHHIEKIKKERG